MHNLSTVIRFEFIRTIKKKSFWLSLLAFPTIMLAVFGAMYFSSSVAEQTSQRQQEEGFSTVIMDDSSIVSKDIISNMGSTPIQDKAEGITAVKNQKYDAFIYYPANPSKSSIEIYAKDSGLMENAKYETVAKELLRASASSQINSPELLSIIRGDISSELTTFKNGEPVAGFERAIAPGIFLVLFYAIIVLLGNQMLISTTEEKENRVIEMILTTLEAKTLIVGKIIALVLIGIVQVIVIVAPAIALYLVAGDQLNLPAFNLSQIQFDWTQIVIGALLFVVSFFLFTGILVAIGAAVPTAKEANSFFGIAIFAMFIPLYSLPAIISDPSQLVVKIFSFFPLTAPVTLMSRNAVGNLTNIEAIVGLIALAAFSLIALAVAVHTFRFGTLEYDRKLSWREIFPIKI